MSGAGAVRVSVILPIYNAENTLDKSLESVLTQEGVVLEVICVNDGSTDDTPAILEQWASRDSRVVILSQENQGAGPARNAGMAIASGDYIAFLDPDDWLPNQYVYSSLVEMAIVHETSVAGGNLQRFNRLSGRPQAAQELDFRNDGLVSFEEYQFAGYFTRFVYSARFLRVNHIGFPDYRRYQDPLFLAQALIAAGTFYATKDCVYCYAAGSHVSWNARKVVDWCRGVSDVLDLSRSRGLALLHERTAAGLFDGEIVYEAARLSEGSVSALKALRLAFAAIDEGLLSESEPYDACRKQLEYCELRASADPEGLKSWATRMIRKRALRNWLRMAAWELFEPVMRARQERRTAAKGSL